MGLRLALVAAVIISVTGIKIPIENTDENSQVKTVADAESSEKPIYYQSDDDEVDSYLVPVNSHQPLEDISDEIATLATYLQPPSEDKQSDYYKPTEAGEQTDWYPIAPVVPPLSRQLLPPRQGEDNPVSIEVNQSKPTYSIYGSLRTGKLLDVGSRVAPVPSRDLQPPLENAPNEYVASESDGAINIPRPARPKGYPLSVWNGPIISIPNSIRDSSLPKISYITKKNPTKLYPKKYPGSFKPIPIPLAHFDGESEIKIQNDKPQKQFKPNKNVNKEYTPSSDDKNIFKFEEGQKKRLLKEKPENMKQRSEPETSESNEDVPSLEQDTSASNYRIPSRHAYAAPLRQAPKSAPTHQQSHAAPPDGERTEFRMHGMKGPHSYQFGFDTGKGKNRQFRYEERDNDGRVKGHYGYMDKNGKLRVVNYDADPEHGFRAEPPVDAE